MKIYFGNFAKKTLGGVFNEYIYPRSGTRPTFRESRKRDDQTRSNRNSCCVFPIQRGKGQPTTYLDVAR
jgi:hypothetical protein